MRYRFYDFQPPPWLDIYNFFSKVSGGATAPMLRTSVHIDRHSDESQILITTRTA